MTGIILPFPHPALWPNKRPHWATKSRETRKHKQWAHDAALGVLGLNYRPSGKVRLAYTVFPKTRHAIDKDNAVAAFKSYQDGIAAALRVDDSTFDTPTVTFAEPVKGGQILVRVEAA